MFNYIVKMNCIKQSPAFKGHFTLSSEWLLKTGLTVMEILAHFHKECFLSNNKI